MLKLVCWEIVNNILSNPGRKSASDYNPKTMSSVRSSLELSVCVLQVWGSSGEEQAPDHTGPARVSAGAQKEL